MPKLVLSGYNMTTFPVLDAFCSLRELDLSDNALTTIPVGELIKLELPLEVINFSKNLLNNIEEIQMLSKLRNLKELDVRSNPLPYVSDRITLLEVLLVRNPFLETKTNKLSRSFSSGIDTDATRPLLSERKVPSKVTSSRKNMVRRPSSAAVTRPKSAKPAYRPAESVTSIIAQEIKGKDPKVHSSQSLGKLAYFGITSGGNQKTPAEISKVLSEKTHQEAFYMDMNVCSLPRVGGFPYLAKVNGALILVEELGLAAEGIHLTHQVLSQKLAEGSLRFTTEMVQKEVVHSHPSTQSVDPVTGRPQTSSHSTKISQEQLEVRRAKEIQQRVEVFEKRLRVLIRYGIFDVDQEEEKIPGFSDSEDEMDSTMASSRQRPKSASSLSHRGSSVFLTDGRNSPHRRKVSFPRRDLQEDVEVIEAQHLLTAIREPGRLCKERKQQEMRKRAAGNGGAHEHLKHLLDAVGESSLLEIAADEDAFVSALGQKLSVELHRTRAIIDQGVESLKVQLPATDLEILGYAAIRNMKGAVLDGSKESGKKSSTTLSASNSNSSYKELKFSDVLARESEECRLRTRDLVGEDILKIKERIELPTRFLSMSLDEMDASLTRLDMQSKIDFAVTTKSYDKLSERKLKKMVAMERQRTEHFIRQQQFQLHKERVKHLRAGLVPPAAASQGGSEGMQNALQRHKRAAEVKANIRLPTDIIAGRDRTALSMESSSHPAEKTEEKEKVMEEDDESERAAKGGVDMSAIAWLRPIEHDLLNIPTDTSQAEVMKRCEDILSTVKVDLKVLNEATAKFLDEEEKYDARRHSDEAYLLASHFRRKYADDYSGLDIGNETLEYAAAFAGMKAQGSTSRRRRPASAAPLRQR
jgi:hypothetical protein